MKPKAARPFVAFKKDYVDQWQLYAFLLPSIIFIFVFAYIPMSGAQIAFKNYKMELGIWGSKWVGLDNFQRFLDSYNFLRIVRNTISVSLYGLIIGFPIPIMFALVLNSFYSKRYSKLVQTITYVPHFISTVVIVGMLMQLFNPRAGAFGALYTLFTNQTIPDLFGIPAAFQHLYVWSGIWQGVGWSAIIYIAALSGVDPEIHEAAMIDGASRFQRVLHIDIPHLLPTAVIMLILSTGQIMNVGFEKVFLMQNSLNASTSEVISTYVYRVGLTMGLNNFSYATAIGLFNAGINFALMITVNQIAKRLGYHGLW